MPKSNPTPPTSTVEVNEILGELVIKVWNDYRGNRSMEIDTADYTPKYTQAITQLLLEAELRGRIDELSHVDFCVGGGGFVGPNGTTWDERLAELQAQLTKEGK